MNVMVKGRHMDITPALKDYAESKTEKAAHILDHQVMQADVELYVEKNPAIENNQVCEITMFTKGPVIRAKEAATDLYAAIDLASDKLERQLRKYKGKMVDRHTGKGQPAPKELFANMTWPGPDPLGGGLPPEIVKTKQVSVHPMSVEDAVLQLELLGHDFFIFATDDSPRSINVLYRRGDGDYGLIEPTVVEE